MVFHDATAVPYQTTYGCHMEVVPIGGDVLVE